MLTERELVAVGYVFRTCASLYILPFDWDAVEGGKLQTTKSAFKNFTSAACTILSWTYFTFKCLRLPNLLSTSDWKSDWTVYFVYQICFLTVSCIHTNNHFFTSGIANVFNNLVRFNKAEGTRYFGREYEPPNKREDATLAFIGTFVNFFVCVMLFFCVYPNMHMFFYSLVPETQKSPPVFAFFLLLETVAIFNLIITYTFYILMQYCYILCMKFWLHKICVSWPATEKMGNQNINTPKLLALFKKLQLLNNEYNRSYSRLLTPIVQVTMFSLAVQCCYSTVRFVHSVPVVMSLINVGMFFMAQLQLLIGTTLVADLHELSGSCQRNFKGLVIRSGVGAIERKKLFREIEASKPFGFQVGRLYVIKQGTKATLVNMLINTISSMLLTF